LTPKITKRTPKEKVHYADAGRKAPGHDLNQPAKPRSTKDTKRWCRGKVGREHQYQITKRHTGPYTWDNYDTWTCAQCGKNWIRRPDKAPATTEE
jgi:hypothetical protein